MGYQKTPNGDSAKSRTYTILLMNIKYYMSITYEIATYYSYSSDDLSRDCSRYSPSPSVALQDWGYAPWSHRRRLSQLWRLSAKPRIPSWYGGCLTLRKWRLEKARLEVFFCIFGLRLGSFICCSRIYPVEWRSFTSLLVWAVLRARGLNSSRSSQIREFTSPPSSQLVKTNLFCNFTITVFILEMFFFHYMLLVVNCLWLSPPFCQIAYLTKRILHNPILFPVSACRRQLLQIYRITVLSRNPRATDPVESPASHSTPAISTTSRNHASSAASNLLP